VATPVIMPKTGMTQETGTIVQWLVKEGERVEKGQPILEVMTDKVNMEVEAPASGLLTNIKASPDDVVAVTRVIAYIAEPGEEVVEAEGAAEVHEPRLESGEVERPRPGRPVGKLGAAVPAPGKVKATPMARRLAQERGIDLASLTGTGPGGAITKADVLKAAERPDEPPAPGPSIARTIPLVGRRRAIAERMQQSSQQAPHIALSIDVDMSAAAKARGEASYTALLVQVVARALRQHPLLNSTLRDGSIIVFNEINVGVAIAAEDGLIVAVVKHADTKTLQEVEAELKDLSQRARVGELTLDDVAGGAFTVSNLGMFGITQFRAIIKPPEAAILAVGSIVERAVAIEGGIHIRPMMTITASADHRILDGVAVAGFLQDVKAALEGAA
jgi:pyruvate dehydrogenase E2 component (dihydrolipoamide acetyltransferase)